MSYKKNQRKFQRFVSHYQLFKAATKKAKSSSMKQNVSRFCIKVKEYTLRQSKIHNNIATKKC